MPVGPDGKFLLSDEYPVITFIQPRIEVGKLVLESPLMPKDVAVPITDKGPRIFVTMFTKKMVFEAVVDTKASDWIQTITNVDGAMLVHLPQDIVRTDGRGVAELGLADSSSMSLSLEESLVDLNGRIKQNGHEPVSWERFGHDLWVKGTDAYQEDAWAEIIIGEKRFAVIKPIERCARTLIRREAKILTERKKKDREPLDTLAQYRRLKNGKTIFGQKVAHLGKGEIRVGDKVKVVDYKDFPELR